MSGIVSLLALVHLILLVAPLLSVAESLPGGGEKEEIQRFLRSTMEAGYREEDIRKFISPYDDGAEIVNYVYGKIDKKTLEEKTIKDFERLSDQEVRVDVLETSQEEGGVVVMITISVKGSLSGGERANRHDRHYLYMNKVEGQWKIFRQSYRRDFGVTEFPHLGE